MDTARSIVYALQRLVIGIGSMQTAVGIGHLGVRPSTQVERANQYWVAYNDRCGGGTDLGKPSKGF